jgi:hypothetical protein
LSYIYLAKACKIVLFHPPSEDGGNSTAFHIAICKRRRYAERGAIQPFVRHNTEISNLVELPTALAVWNIRIKITGFSRIVLYIFC